MYGNVLSVLMFLLISKIHYYFSLRGLIWMKMIVIEIFYLLPVNGAGIWYGTWGNRCLFSRSCSWSVDAFEEQVSYSVTTYRCTTTTTTSTSDIYTSPITIFTSTQPSPSQPEPSAFQPTSHRCHSRSRSPPSVSQPTRHCIRNPPDFISIIFKISALYATDTSNSSDTSNIDSKAWQKIKLIGRYSTFIGGCSTPEKEVINAIIYYFDIILWSKKTSASQEQNDLRSVIVLLIMENWYGVQVIRENIIFLSIFSGAFATLIRYFHLLQREQIAINLFIDGPQSVLPVYAINITVLAFYIYSNYVNVMNCC